MTDERPLHGAMHPEGVGRWCRACWMYVTHYEWDERHKHHGEERFSNDEHSESYKMSDNLATNLGFNELTSTAAIVFREGDDLHSFVGDYGPTDEHFRKVACSTMFYFDGDEIVVIGDFNGHAVFRRFDDDYGSLAMITWARLVDECEPVADGWITMPKEDNE